MNATKTCDLCDTALDFETDGQRFVFTAHDAAFCATATRGRIRDLERALRSAAEDRAHAEACLLRRVAWLELEVEVLREDIHDAADRIPDENERASARRRIEDRKEWEARVAARLETRRAREAERLLEVQRLAAMAAGVRR